MIFDSHAHYDDAKFDEDRAQLLNSMAACGIGYIVNVGADLESTKRSLLLAEQYPFIYAACGVHPSDAAQLDEIEDGFDQLRKYCSHEKCVAVGEIGLDYYWDKEDDVRSRQKYWFEQQLLLSKEMNLPIIIHSRDAAKDTLDMMKSQAGQGTMGVMHCFSYSVEIAREYLNMGYYLGIGGVVTFANAKTIKEVVRYAPIEQILLETDCPYLAPVPNRGKRNSSLNLPYVAEMIAELKHMHKEDVVDITCKNAKNMYGIA